MLEGNPEAKNTRSSERDELDTALDSIILSEEGSYDKGYKEGFQKGTEHSFPEGFTLGIQFGTKFFKELGYIHGFCSQLLLKKEERKVGHQILVNLIDSVERLKGGKSFQSQEDLNKIRLQFKKVKSIYKVPNSAFESEEEQSASQKNSLSF